MDILHSVNSSDCIVRCQSRYPLCMAVSYWEGQRICHLMAGGLEDPSTSYDVDEVWTSYVIYTKGIVFRISLSRKKIWGQFLENLKPTSHIRHEQIMVVKAIRELRSVSRLKIILRNWHLISLT